MNEVTLRSPRTATEQTVRIRRARAVPDDMELVADMIRSSAEWYREIVDEEDMTEHEVGPDWAKDNFARRTFYIGHVEDEPFGTISMQTFGTWCYVGYVYLDVDFVGQGLGRVLLDFVAERAATAGLDGLALIAHPEATWATKAYEKFGFQIAATDREDVLAWQHGVLRDYYEEGFELYLHPFANAIPDGDRQ